MNQTEYAKHRGVVKSAVSNWKKSGLLVFREGKVDVAATDKVLSHAIDPGRGRPTNAEPASSTDQQAAPDTTTSEPPASNPPPPSLAGGSENQVQDENGQLKLNFNVERARELYEKRVGQAMKNAAMAGDMVPLAAYLAKLEGAVGGFCDNLAAELRGMADRLANEDDPRAIRTLLEDTLHDARQDYADRYGLTDDEADTE